MTMNPLRNRLVLVVSLSVVVLFGAVVYAATSTILGVGTNLHSQIVNGPATMTARRLTIPAGEVGVWHYHPGLITAVITRGVVTVEDGCGGSETFTAGQAFEKNNGRVHRAINPGTEEEEEYNMFIVPQGDPITVNIPSNQRLCGPALVVDECKDNGWMKFNYPHPFNDQGECVSSVRKED
jgi:quercetin dioxygenase-like cupin family protein